MRFRLRRTSRRIPVVATAYQTIIPWLSRQHRVEGGVEVRGEPRRIAVGARQQRRGWCQQRQRQDATDEAVAGVARGQAPAGVGVKKPVRRTGRRSPIR